MDVSKRASGAVAARERFRAPWGLLALLVLYAIPAGVYLWLSSRGSPEYLAAKHDAVAQALLGRDSGRHLSDSELTEAYSELIAAARLQPHIRRFHEDMETLNTRFAERGLRPAPDLLAQASALGAQYSQAEAARQAPILGEGAANRGWNTEDILAQFQKALVLAALGLGLVVLLWGYGQYRLRAERQLSRHHAIEDIEADVERLGEFRRTVKGPQPMDSQGPKDSKDT